MCIVCVCARAHTHACIHTSFEILPDNTEEKRLLGVPKHKWKDCIGVVLKHVGCEGMDCIHFTQNRVH